MSSQKNITSPPISDHALIRWLERAYNLDIEEERSRLAASIRPFIVSPNMTLKKNGHKFIIRKGGVTTILFDDSSPSLQGGKR